MKTTKPEPGELERAVMKIVWAHTTVSAEAVREQLGRGHKETTVRTVLRRLEEKGLVRHEVDNRTFMYSAVETRARVAARAVKRIVDWFCDGSVDEVLVGMVDSEMLDKAQLGRLMERVEQAKQEKKGSGRARKGVK